MKMFIPVLALAASFAPSAFATPSVGDVVQFQGTWGAEAVYQQLSFTAFNTSTRQFTQLTITKIGTNAPASQEDLVNYDDTASDAALDYIVNNCSSQGGVSETITVPAGTFRTCKRPLQAGGYVWIAQVPFAVAKIETPAQGKTLSAVLVGVTRGSGNP